MRPLIDLGPLHASVYLLELYPHAPLKEEMARAGWSLAPDEDAAEMYLETMGRLDAEGYEQYEISNVARPSCRCRHNLKYWRNGDWLGFGCGAHSTRHGARWKNVSETDRYIQHLVSGLPVMTDRYDLTEEERLGDHLFMGLRLTEGVDLTDVNREYGVDVMAQYGAPLAPFLEAAS